MNEKKYMYNFGASIKWLFMVLVIVETMILGWILVHKKMGYYDVCSVWNENEGVQSDIIEVQNLITSLIEKKREWHQDTFFQERYLRETLHRGKKDEIIFFYK